jgi:KUP system potassium uptake protein
MLWSLTIIVGLKYLILLTRVDNQGEGGVFALYALLRSARVHLTKRGLLMLSLIALAGAALLYGDGTITPAISVLSAVEGLELLHPAIKGSWIVPVVASLILLGLFMFQKHGTARIGFSFGPVMLLWFIVLALLGVFHISDHPAVLRAIYPWVGWEYLLREGTDALHIMGTVLLAVTGCEALYADVGHFGRQAMNRSWFWIAYPGLVLNYLGQGAFLLAHPTKENFEQPFFNMVPQALFIPVVVLATLAAIIASQGIITGVFSLTQQAVQLGFMPRLKIIHTSADVKGQVYLPQINGLLMVACLGLVLVFKDSASLAAAYGLSVSSDMILSSALLFLVMRRVWNWPTWQAALPVGIFLSIEGCYWIGSFSKLMHGAWIPLVITAVLWTVMKTWRDGRAVLMKRVVRSTVPASHLVDELAAGKITRVPGIGVFLTSSLDGIPLVLLHHLKHNRVLHQTAVLLTVRFEEEPYVSDTERVEVVDLDPTFFRVILRYGFAESPEVMRDLTKILDAKGVKKQNDVSFYQSRELLVSDGPSKMAQWRKKLFIFLSRIARPATGYFQLPSWRVIELGIQLDL